MKPTMVRILFVDENMLALFIRLLLSSLNNLTKTFNKTNQVIQLSELRSPELRLIRHAIDLKRSLPISSNINIAGRVDSEVFTILRH
jgi:hypothetical protein